MCPGCTFVYACVHYGLLATVLTNCLCEFHQIYCLGTGTLYRPYLTKCVCVLEFYKIYNLDALREKIN